MARFVYFIQASNGLIKIGQSKDVLMRFRNLKGESPLELYLMNVTDRHTEIELHERFKDDRDHGEWYLPSPALINFIANLPDRIPYLYA